MGRHFLKPSRSIHVLGSRCGRRVRRDRRRVGLRPAAEVHARRERIGAGARVAVDLVLAPVVEHVAQHRARLRRRGRHLDVVAVGEQGAAPAERAVDPTRRPVRDRRCRRPGGSDCVLGRGRRPVGGPARPQPARLADLRPADGRLRPDRHGRARRRSSASSAGSSRSTRSRSSSSTRPRRPRTGRSGRTAASTRRRSCRRSPSNASGEQRARRLDDHPAARPGPAPPRQRDRRRARIATCARPRS